MSILQKEADYVVRYCCDNYLNQNNFVEDNIRRAVNYNLDVITPGELALTTRGTSQVVLSKSAINEIYRKSKHKVYKEHIENYCFENWRKFKIDYQIIKKDFFYENLNFSVDNQEDIDFIKKNKIINLLDIKKLIALNNEKKPINIKDKKYLVEENKFVKKNRIGYKSIYNFYNPIKVIYLNKHKNKKYLEFNFLIKNLFSALFTDDDGNIYYPSYLKKKFIKIKFKKLCDKKWSSYFLQQLRIKAYRELFELN